MSRIMTVTSPKDEFGNDPNDFRNDEDYLNKIEGQIQSQSVLNWTEAFKVSIEEANAISDPEWIIPDIVIRGHLIVIPAEPNGGKTTIFFHLSKEMVERGYQVFYVNADISGGDAKEMVIKADQSGFALMLPDMKVGLSMDDVVANLIKMNLDGGDYSRFVFIFDTLKKMTDVINKTRAKELYKTLRGLSSKGMTIILLAHTNKYSGEDGKPIYEGTGDLRSDVDELIYLIPQKNPDGSMTVSTEPDKTRGKFQNITFQISPDREVTRLDSFYDVATARKQAVQREQDEPTIEAINSAIAKGNTKQVDIISHCKAFGIGKRSIQAVLNRYSAGQDCIWNMERGMQHNTKFYQMNEEYTRGAK